MDLHPTFLLYLINFLRAFLAYKEHGLFQCKDGKIGWEEFSPELNKEEVMLGSWIYWASMSLFFCFS